MEINDVQPILASKNKANRGKDREAAVQQLPKRIIKNNLGARRLHQRTKVEMFGRILPFGKRRDLRSSPDCDISILWAREGERQRSEIIKSLSTFPKNSNRRFVVIRPLTNSNLYCPPFFLLTVSFIVKRE